MKKKIILFDFDGTIADSMKSILKIINRLSKEFGYKKIRDEEIDRYRNKEVKESFQELGISIIKLPFVVQRIRSELNKEIKALELIKGIKIALLNLKKSGYKLGILTSNSEGNVIQFLRKNNLEIFDFIYCGSSLFGKGRVIRSCLKNHRLKSEEVIYVGDETRDIEAAKKVKIKVIAVSWGFNKREILESLDPEYLINTPEELLHLFKVGHLFKAGP